MRRPHQLLAVLALILLLGCSDEGLTITNSPAAPTTSPPTPEPSAAASIPEAAEGAAVPTTPPPTGPATAKATFGAGCFWCVEAVFQRLNGVSAVQSGYTGGHVENPAYRDVCNGTTGHAEVAQITYDPDKVTFRELLEVFWKTHDPTTLNQQGADRGTQYRSAVFYHSDEQRDEAEALKKSLDESGAFDRPIVTEISKLGTYYEAEDYHQDYFNLNPDQGYCRAVVGPKVEKFKKAFADKLKKETSETK